MIYLLEGTVKDWVIEAILLSVLGKEVHRRKKKLYICIFHRFDNKVKYDSAHYRSAFVYSPRFEN